MHLREVSAPTRGQCTCLMFSVPFSHVKRTMLWMFVLCSLVSFASVSTATSTCAEPCFRQLRANFRTARHPTGTVGSKYPPAEPGALDCEPLKAAGRGR